MSRLRPWEGWFAAWGAIPAVVGARASQRRAAAGNFCATRPTPPTPSLAILENDPRAARSRACPLPWAPPLLRQAARPSRSSRALPLDPSLARVAISRLARGRPTGDRVESSFCSPAAALSRARAVSTLNLRCSHFPANQGFAFCSPSVNSPELARLS